MSDSTDRCFSPDLDERLKASRSASISCGRWIAGCRGAANSYVVLLGSSPGAAAPGESTFADVLKRPSWEHSRSIGARAGIGQLPFGEGDKRNARWMRLLLAAFGDDHQETQQAVDSLTAIWNLDWRHEAKETGTASESLERGAEDIVNLATEVKPRVIVTLTGQVGEIFSAAIRRHKLRVEYSEDAIKNPPHPYSVWFRGVAFPTLVIRSIRHPSYSTLTDARLALIAKCCGDARHLDEDRRRAVKRGPVTKC